MTKRKCIYSLVALASSFMAQQGRHGMALIAIDGNGRARRFIPPGHFELHGGIESSLLVENCSQR